MDGIFTNLSSPENCSKQIIPIIYPDTTCDLNANMIQPPFFIFASAPSQDNGATNEMMALTYACGVFTTIANGAYRMCGMYGPGSHQVGVTIQNGIFTGESSHYFQYRWIIMSL